MRSKGFTLIELLVVVLIIAILAAIALPKYELAVEKARSREAFSTIAQLEISFRDYYLSQGRPAYGTRPQGQTVFNALNVSLNSSYVFSNNNNYVCSKTFMYSVDCNPWWDMCQISAFRLSGRDDPSKCSLYAMQDTKYVITGNVYFDKGTIRTCYNWSTGDHTFGQKFCSMLKDENIVEEAN